MGCNDHLLKAKKIIDWDMSMYENEKIFRSVVRQSLNGSIHQSRSLTYRQLRCVERAWPSPSLAFSLKP